MVHTTIEDAFDTVLQYMNVTSRQCKVSYWKLCLVQKLPVPILLFAIKKVASRLLHCTIDHIVHAEVFRTFLYLVRVRQPHMSIALKYVDQLAVSSFFFFRDY